MSSLVSRSSRLLLESFVLVVIVLLGIMLARVQPVQAQSATGIAYSDDPATGHYGTWAANVVIYFDGPGTTFTVNQNGSFIGSLFLGSSPAQVGGFNPNFAGGNNGDVFSVTPGGASCQLTIANGFRYCGVGIPTPPDGDGDGVPDASDACPSQGSVDFGIYPNGCPIFDTDGDGIADNLDACPAQGSVGFGIYANGCPIFDSDGDGVGDNVDFCPSVRGPAANNGCPLTITGVPPTPVPSVETPIDYRTPVRVTDTPVPIVTRTPDPNAACNIVVKNPTQGVNIRSSPSTETRDNIVSTIPALGDPRPVSGWVITPNGNWWVVEGGYVFSGAVNFGGIGCADIVEGTGSDTPPTAIPTIDVEILSPILNDCRDQLNYIREELPTDVQYLIVENPETACDILRANQYFGAEVEDQIGSATLSTLFSECPVEAAQYTALLQQMYQANSASAVQLASSLNSSGDICAAIRAFIERFGLNQGNSDRPDDPPTDDPYVLVLGCLHNVTATRARIIANAIGSDISSLGDNPCAVVERYNLIQTIPDDQRPLYDRLINECNLSVVDALDYLLLLAAGFQFSSAEPCRTTIPDIGPVIPSDTPERIQQCDATMVNLFMWIRTNRNAITPPLSETEEGFILSASDPCAALYSYLSRGLIDLPSVPINPPPPTEVPGGEPTLPSTVTPVADRGVVSITIGSPEPPPFPATPNAGPENPDAADSLLGLFTQNSTSALVTVLDGDRQMTYQFIDATSSPLRVYDESSASQINLSIGSGGWGAYIEAKDGQQTLWFQQTIHALNPERARYPVEFQGYAPAEHARIAWHPDERSLFVPLRDLSTDAIGIYFIRLIDFNNPDRSQAPYIPDATDPFVVGSYLVYRSTADNRLYFVRISDLMSNPGLDNAGVPIRTTPQNTICESADAVYRGENANLENDIVLICGNMLYVGNVDNAENTASIELTESRLSGQASDVSLVPGLQNVFTLDDGRLAFSINIVDGHVDVLGFAVDGKPITRLEWTQFIDQ